MVDRQSIGTVREWHDDQGWGVLDSPDTPGGCWVHISSIEPAGHPHLRAGQQVRFGFESAHQDGFGFRVTTGSPHDVSNSAGAGAAEAVRVIRPHDLTGADPTTGMSRELAFESGLLWSGRVTTAPGAVSGWHHHDLNVSSLYVVQGILRLEFAGVAGHLDAQAGDFIQVPAYTVHRESNPTGEPSVAVIARAGGGVPTVNVATAPAPHRD